MAGMKFKDYSNTAVNLCNPPELKTLLANLAPLKALETVLQADIAATPSSIQLALLQKEIAESEGKIRIAIDIFGSFQDTEAGVYAIRQRRISVTYVASRVKEFLRSYATAVIEEVVNKSKLEGLRKGGLVTQEDLDRCSDTTESFAYIIKAAVPESKQSEKLEGKE